MRFLADENFFTTSVRLLRAAGHDVAAASEDAPGDDDERVLARAAREGRVLLTLDQDYGELIYRRGLPAPPGVVLFRFLDAQEEAAERLLHVLRVEGRALEGQFTVVTPEHVRQRSLP